MLFGIFKFCNRPAMHHDPHLSCPISPLIIVSVVENQGKILWRVARLSLKQSQLEMAHGMQIYIYNPSTFMSFGCHERVCFVCGGSLAA